ncbi:hypothetical protein GAY28_00300 [Azospirillum brasilense]|nr:hypothetical protein [Azospirillum brasilense]
MPRYRIYASSHEEGTDNVNGEGVFVEAETPRHAIAITMAEKCGRPRPESTPDIEAWVDLGFAYERWLKEEFPQEYADATVYFKDDLQAVEVDADGDDIRVRIP